jgi:hypothetical protein
VDTKPAGLTGPDDDSGSDFAVLFKGNRATNKADVDSAGSYGIDKNGAYAIADSLH